MSLGEYGSGEYHVRGFALTRTRWGISGHRTMVLAANVEGTNTGPSESRLDIPLSVRYIGPKDRVSLDDTCPMLRYLEESVDGMGG